MKIVIDGTVVEIPKQSGIPGEDGKSAYDIAVENGFEGTVDEWLESLVGPQGEQGNVGPQGLQGIQGPQGEKGDTGDQGIQGPQGSKGDKGDKGDQGIQGPQGSKGDKGDKGDQGIQGPKGDTGLTGSQGPKGDTGLTGPQGPTGKTAYQYAVDGGYTGTEDEFKTLMGTGPWLPTTGGRVSGSIEPDGGVEFKNPYGGIDGLWLQTAGDNNEPVLAPMFNGNTARIRVGTPIQWADAANKGYVHDYVPIPLPIEKGGTGAQDGPTAMLNLMSSLETHKGSIYGNYIWFPVYSNYESDAYPSSRMSLNTLRVQTINKSTSVESADANYTLYMARAIAFLTAVPTSMTNGRIAFTY